MPHRGDIHRQLPTTALGSGKRKQLRDRASHRNVGVKNPGRERVVREKNTEEVTERPSRREE